MIDPATLPIPRQLSDVLHSVPTIFAAAGQAAAWRFIEFFTANIRNANTRAAYARAVTQFSQWCDERHLQLHEVNPFLVSAYIEELGLRMSKPTVKQHLAGLRTLFDWLVIGQVVPSNPASSVRGPKHVVKRGKTPVLTPDEARSLLDSIDTQSMSGLRDRAIISMMVFSFARVGAVVGMDTDDYYPQGKRFWFRLHEKGGKRHDLPVHHKAEEYMDAYLAAAGIQEEKGTPLFRSLNEKRVLTERRMSRRDLLAMVKRRARHAGIPTSTCCHTFRATGITAFLLNGGTLENAARIASHESTGTTQLYNRTGDTVSLDEIERIVI
jgi:integrase/recombinase XerD